MKIIRHNKPAGSINEWLQQALNLYCVMVVLMIIGIPIIWIPQED